jgi:hypothetical protein
LIQGDEMSVNEESWKLYQKHLGYSDEEMKIFKETPRNEEVIKKAAELMNHTIVVKVVDSHGCNSQHKVGDKFYFDGAGGWKSNNKTLSKKDLHLCSEFNGNRNFYFKRIVLCRC